MHSPSRPAFAHSGLRRACFLACVLVGVVLAPSPAAAHGLDEVGADMSVLDFVSAGFEHMLAGWDHLLFIAGVLLLARSVKRSAKMITAFVIGHSTTLIIATLAGWQVDPGLVDATIVVSVVFVGLLALVGGTTKYTELTVVVLAFGLVHGLGLSTRLQAVGLPEDGLLLRVVAFNVGIEIGQLTAIAIIAGIGVLLLMFTGNEKIPTLAKLAGAAVFAAGVVALPLVIYNAATADDDATAVAAEEAATGENCTAAPRTTGFPAGGGHAAKPFYEPSEPAPLADFGHSLGDGYVVVLYDPELPETDVDDLRSFVSGSQGLLAGPSPGLDGQVTVITMYETLTCEEFEVEPLTEFAGSWFDQ